MVVRDAQAVRGKIQDRMKVGLCGVQKNIPLVSMIVVMTRATAACDCCGADVCAD